MKFLSENLFLKSLLSKSIGAIAILLFIISSPTKSFIWSSPSVDYLEIATGEWQSRSIENRNIECASSSNKTFGGRIRFQNREGKDVGFIPFTIKPFGMLKSGLQFSSFNNDYGTFRLEVDYRYKKSLNCYLTLDPARILLPFDRGHTTNSYISLGAETQNRQADNISLSISNLSRKESLNLNVIFYAKDGVELKDLEMQLGPISPKGRLIQMLPDDVLVKSGLIKLVPKIEKSSYSAHLFARGLDEELYNSNYISTAMVGSCNSRKFQISNDAHEEEPLLEIVNVSDQQSRAFLTLSSRSGQKVIDDSVLIPAGATYPFRINLDNTAIIGGTVSISCDKGEVLAVPSWISDESFTLEAQENYTSVSLPIIRKKGIKNIIKLNSESPGPSLVEITIYSTTGEKLYSPFEQIELQGSLMLPLDQHLGPKFQAVAVVSSKRSTEELLRVALLMEEDSDEVSDSVLKFPESRLSSKEVIREEKSSKKDDELADNLLVRREKDFASLITDPEFDTHCIKRSRTAMPDGLINQDSLEFNLNLRKLLRHGVTEVKTFQITNKEQFDMEISKHSNFFSSDYVNSNSSIFANNYLNSEISCLSLLYGNIQAHEKIQPYIREVQNLSFDFRKLLLKGTIEKKLKLEGAAWLKPSADNYLFCFRTTPDCEYEQRLPTQYIRSFLSPNGRTPALKASNYYPLLTIDRPYKPLNSNKNFKIKAYLHAKVPYEILATLSGIKTVDKNEAINCKELNGKYHLQLQNNKWISSRQRWDRSQKFDLSLSYNPITFVHSQSSSANPEVADNCNKFFKECNIGMWSVNVANGLSFGTEPHGWGRFLQKDKFAYRWTDLPLLEKREVEFNKFEVAGNDMPRCDYANAKIKLKASRELSTLPEVIAKREAINTYLLPRKIYHPDTYPINQPAPGIPYQVESNLNPYVSTENRMVLSTSPEVIGKRWLDQIP